jgi:hypothetical protein
MGEAMENNQDRPDITGISTRNHKEDARNLQGAANECHSVDAEDSHHFNIESGSSSVTKHLRNVHKINWTRKGPVVPFVRKGVTPSLDLNSHKPREQELLNQMALAFDPDTSVDSLYDGLYMKTSHLEKSTATHFASL